MKKEDIKNEVLRISKEYKIDNQDFINELLDLVGPKSRVTIAENPPKLDSDNNIIELFCIRFNKYLNVEEFGKSTKTKSGYSKESKIGIKIWNIYNKEIQELKKTKISLLDDILEGRVTIKESKIKSTELEEKILELEELRKNPYSEELYNEHK